MLAATFLSLFHSINVKKKHDQYGKISKSLKTEIWDHFEEYNVIYLATIKDDKPRVRPITLLYMDGRFWLLTGTGSAKVKQVQANQKVEFCFPLKSGEQSGYIRAGGNAIIIHDQENKNRLAQKCSFFDEYWQAPDDPNYTLVEFKISKIEYMKPGWQNTKRHLV